MSEWNKQIANALMGYIQDDPSTSNVRNTLMDTVINRATLFPAADYADGTTRWAWPGVLYEPAAAWGRMMQGDTSPENALTVAGSAMAGAMPFAQRNAVGIFGGRLAKTADHAKLDKAESMAKQGLPREQIWNETGWFQGVDGKWRFEIDDRTLEAGVGVGKIRHDNLEAAYPDRQPMSDVQRTLMPGGGYIPPPDHAKEVAGKVYAFGPTNALRRQMAAHELQHHVQGLEGFGRGSNPVEFGTWNIPMVPFSYTPRSSMSKYQRTSGEVEARAVEKRVSMTPEQRRARYPWLDFDTPDDQQLVLSRK